MKSPGTHALPSATSVLALAVQRSVDLVSFGLQAASTVAVEELTVPGSFQQLVAMADRRMTVEEARVEFRSWVLAGGLRDCVEALGSALEWARKECAIWSLPGTVTTNDDGQVALTTQVRGRTWMKLMNEDAGPFDRLPLPEKIKRLADLGMTRPPYTDDVLSLNAARNCLAHRRGVVGPEDLRVSSDSGLTVSWRGWRLTATGPDGMRQLTAGSQVTEDDRVTVSLQPLSRTYELGARISLSAEEFLEIASTFSMYAGQLEVSIGALRNQRYETQANEGSTHST